MLRIKLLALLGIVFTTAASAQTQTQTDTTCRTSPDGRTINCESTSKSNSPANGGGAAAGVADALSKRRRAPIDWDAQNKAYQAEFKQNFEQAQSKLADLRINYAQHQQAGDPFPKENLKAFNRYRKDACKWGKKLKDPVPMGSIVSDLDGTPRTCAESKKFE